MLITIPFDNNTATFYQQQITAIKTKLNSGGSLSSADHQIISDYYQYIAKTGVLYGIAAGDIVNGTGSFGALGNKYFENVLKDKGYSPTSISLLKDKFMTDLALRDVTYRLSNNGIASNDVIESYHFAALDELGLPHVAWGGSFLDVFGGAGTSLDFGGYDTGTDIQQENLIESYFLNKFKDGVYAKESFGYLVDAMTQAENIGYFFNSSTSRFIKALKTTGQEIQDIMDGEIIDTAHGIDAFLKQLTDKINSITSGLSDTLSAAYWKFLDSIAKSLIDPLIIDLNNNGIALDSWQASNALFDLNGNGTKENTGWTKANGDDAFLVIDKNSNGKIDDITEMFGNASIPGFTELAKYDSNKDNLINSLDSQFSLLRLWNDKNANGTVDAGEMTTLAANGVTEISLNKYNRNTLIAGNVENAISTVTINGATRYIHELSFAFDSTTSFTANPDASLPASFQLNIATLILPYSRGYGSLNSWQAAMTLDPVLLSMAQDIAATTPDAIH